MSFDDVLSGHADEIVGMDRDLSLQVGDRTSIVYEFSPNISYDLLTIREKDEMCFTSETFTKEDFHIYLMKIREVTSTTMGDLIDGNTGVDFKIYDGSRKEFREIYFKVIGGRPSPEQVPSFGRIGLYNSEDGTEKAPRVFFVVGHYSTLHILFCDPEHKLYPAKKEK